MIGGGGTALAGNHGGAGDHKTTICHCTAGHGGVDYVKLQVDKSSIVDQAGHTSGHGAHVDDVIPAFSYKDKGGTTRSYPGQGDQSIAANGCKLPEATTTTVAPTTTVPEEEEQSPTTTAAPSTTVPEEEEQSPTTTAAPSTTVPEEEWEEEEQSPTTTAAPSTTVPEEEWEEEEQSPTTTAAPSTTVPETVLPEIVLPETVTPEQAPTTVAPAAPAAPAPEVVAAEVTGTLPETGTGTTALLVAGLGALLSGLGMVQLATTRRQTVRV